MNIKKFVVLSLILVLQSSLRGMEKQRDYLKEAFESSKQGMLVFTEKTPIMRTSVRTGMHLNFSLASNNEKMNISTNRTNHQYDNKNVVAALQYVYAKLADNKFDVTALEHLRDNNSFNSAMYSKDIDEKSSVRTQVVVNDDYYAQISIPTTLTNGFKLDVVSNIIEADEPDREYYDNIYDLARTLLSPAINCENGVRGIFIESFLSKRN